MAKRKRPAAKPTKAFESEGLTKEYGDIVALAPLDLEVDTGHLVALIGHNGSGKSTLMKMAAGLLDSSGGTARIHGKAAGSLPARARLSYLPDAPVLYDDLSVVEHVEYVSRLHGTDDW